VQSIALAGPDLRLKCRREEKRMVRQLDALDAGIVGVCGDHDPGIRESLREGVSDSVAAVMKALERRRSADARKT
jgi:hypothetical protein